MAEVNDTTVVGELCVIVFRPTWWNTQQHNKPFYSEVFSGQTPIVTCGCCNCRIKGAYASHADFPLRDICELCFYELERQLLDELKKR